MLSLPPTVRVFVAIEPLDMRGTFDSLAGAVRRLGLDPVDGHLYLFMNRRRRIAGAVEVEQASAAEEDDRSVAQFLWPQGALPEVDVAEPVAEEVVDHVEGQSSKPLLPFLLRGRGSAALFRNDVEIGCATPPCCRGCACVRMVFRREAAGRVDGSTRMEATGSAPRRRPHQAMTIAKLASPVLAQASR